MCSYFASTHIVCICLFSNRKIEKMKMDYVFLFCLSLSRAGTILSGGVSTIGPPLSPSSSPQHRIISTHFFYFPHHIYFAGSLRSSTTTQSLFCDPDNNKQCDSSEQGVDFKLWYLPIKKLWSATMIISTGSRPPCSCHQTHIWPNAALSPSRLFGELERGVSLQIYL